MRKPQRVIITNCPHDGRHTGIKGYVVDTYPDGTASVDMGHNTCCITAGYEPIDPVKREELRLNDDGLVDDPLTEFQPSPDIPEKKRPGRPKKVRDGSSPPSPREIKPHSIIPVDAPASDPTPLATPQPEPVQAKATTTASPLVSVTAIEGGKVSLTYAVGEARITGTRATPDDFRAVLAIIKALIKGGT